MTATDMLEKRVPFPRYLSYPCEYWSPHPLVFIRAKAVYDIIYNINDLTMISICQLRFSRSSQMLTDGICPVASLNGVVLNLENLKPLNQLEVLLGAMKIYQSHELTKYH